MDAEEDGEGACRQKFFAELFFVLKHRMIFSEVLPQAAIDVTGDGGVNQFCNARILRDSVTSIAPPLRKTCSSSTLKTQCAAVSTHLLPICEILSVFQKEISEIY